MEQPFRKQAELKEEVIKAAKAWVNSYSDQEKEHKEAFIKAVVDLENYEDMWRLCR